MVPAEILDGVLPFSVPVVFRRGKDLRAASPHVLIVGVGVLDLHHHGVGHARLVRCLPSIRRVGHDDDAVSIRHPRTVVADAPQLGEPEGFAKPVDGCAKVVVREFGDDACRSRCPVVHHGQPFQLSQSDSPGPSLAVLGHVGQVPEPVRSLRVEGMAPSDPIRFKQGSVAVRRNVFRGKVRSAWPSRVVHDTGDELTWVCWSGTELTSESSHAEAWRTGDHSHRDPLSELASGEWSLGTSVLQDTTLVGFQLPDVWFSVLLFFHPSGELRQWYVNFEQPYRRTLIGFDTCDHMIDLVFTPDGTHRWKDEDEYAQGRQLGLVTDVQHAEIERAKDQAFAMFEQRTGPFDERWLSWRLDPDWPLPILPDNATAVPAAI